MFWFKTDRFHWRIIHIYCAIYLPIKIMKSAPQYWFWPVCNVRYLCIAQHNRNFWFCAWRGEWTTNRGLYHTAMCTNLCIYKNLCALHCKCAVQTASIPYFSDRKFLEEKIFGTEKNPSLTLYKWGKLLNQCVLAHKLSKLTSVRWGKLVVGQVDLYLYQLRTLWLLLGGKPTV